MLPFFARGMPGETPLRTRLPRATPRAAKCQPSETAQGSAETCPRVPNLVRPTHKIMSKRVPLATVLLKHLQIPWVSCCIVWC